MNIEETKQLCAMALMTWFSEEKENPSMDYKKEDLEIIDEIFTSKMLVNRFKVFDVKIHLPAPLLIILSLCSNENPGLIQVILKRLLLSIKERKGAIPKGYVITTDDFAMCFSNSFPIIEIPSISELYEKLWNEQKKPADMPFETDNLCDTPEWWLEVMN